MQYIIYVFVVYPASTFISYFPCFSSRLNMQQNPEYIFFGRISFLQNITETRQTLDHFRKIDACDNMVFFPGMLIVSCQNSLNVSVF